MATPYNGFDLPVVGADADTWGGKINAVMTAIDALLSSPPNTIKGNNGGAQVATENLTPAEVQAMLPAVVGASQTVSGTKGSVPQPLLTQQNRVLAGDGTWRVGLGRAAGGTITTNNVNGSQPTITGGLNIASISNLTVVGTVSRAQITMTNLLGNAVYQIHSQGNGALTTNSSSHDTKTTSSFFLNWDNSGGSQTEIDFSVFGS